MAKIKAADGGKIAKKHEWLILLCGHYEGIDQRIIDGGWIDEEVSIGDYVLTGGELPAMVLIDAVARHLQAFWVTMHRRIWTVSPKNSGAKKSTRTTRGHQISGDSKFLMS